MKKAKHCKDCVHSIFDETWGDYKCKELKIKVYTPVYQASACKMYEKKKETKE